MRVVLEMNMDGYDSEEEEREAIKIFCEEELDFSASYVKVISIDDEVY